MHKVADLGKGQNHSKGQNQVEVPSAVQQESMALWSSCLEHEIG